MARFRTVASATGTLRPSHDARNNRPTETARRSVSKERRSLIRRSKRGGLETAPPWSFDSKKFKTSPKIAERGLCENIVAFDRGMPAIDPVEQSRAPQISSP